MTYFSNSRRNFLKGLTATSVLSATAIPAIAFPAGDYELGYPESGAPGSGSAGREGRPSLFDGPESPMFKIVPLQGNHEFSAMKNLLTREMADAVDHAPSGRGVAWGIPFEIPDKGIIIKDRAYSYNAAPFISNWLVFLHTSDWNPDWEVNKIGQNKPVKGWGQLNEHVADYHIIYKDGTEERLPVRERHQIGMWHQGWGENNIQSVAHQLRIFLVSVLMQL